MRHLFFVGIGGMGMSGLAKVMASRGHKVAGSDRNLEGDYCKRLAALGIPQYLQDGKGPETFCRHCGVTPDQVEIVKSTAVEDKVPDIETARRIGIKELMRSDLLAQIFNADVGIAVGGTAGKTTTTGLIMWMLHHAGLDPSGVVGGVIGGLDTNALDGRGRHFVIEADESDGSIVKYRPHVALINNIFFDHKPLLELQDLFTTFANHTVEGGIVVLHADDPNIAAIRPRITRPVVTFGLGAGCDIAPEKLVEDDSGSHFTWANTRFSTPLVGHHNVLNVLAAIAIGRHLGLTPTLMSAAIAAFPGMRRRFEKVGTARGVTVIDDFAHNPDEIAATIVAARGRSQRRFIVYQPHGYGPTRLTRRELVEVFASLQHDSEHLYLDEIYYGGGTVEKDISSADLIAEVKPRFPNAHFFGDRTKIIADIASRAKPGDMVVVMGARDINAICKPILDAL